VLIALIVVSVLIAVAVFGLMAGRISLSHSLLLAAAANALLCAENARMGHRALASVNAASCAVCLWTWWHRGGGDGTKRRIRSLRRRFTGVRRTAPVAGGVS
jgi:type II secretory pathway pseudopilin PulG